MNSNINALLVKLSEVDPPHKYHDNEDRLAEHVRDNSGWKIRKVIRRWIGVPYESVLEQGEVQDIDQKNLVRLQRAKLRRQWTEVNYMLICNEIWANIRGVLHLRLNRLISPTFSTAAAHENIFRVNL